MFLYMYLRKREEYILFTIQLIFYISLNYSDYSLLLKRHTK